MLAHVVTVLLVLCVVADHCLLYGQPVHTAKPSASQPDYTSSITATYPQRKPCYYYCTTSPAYTARLANAPDPIYSVRCQPQMKQTRPLCINPTLDLLCTALQQLMQLCLMPTGPMHTNHNACNHTKEVTTMNASSMWSMLVLLGPWLLPQLVLLSCRVPASRMWQGHSHAVRAGIN